MKIYIDGKFYPKEMAKVSVFDHGYLYGDGIYETLRAYGGKVFKLDEHIARLKQSASLMEMTLPLDDNGFVKAITDTIRENALGDAYVRITVSRGEGEIGLDPALCPKPTLVIIAKEFKDYPSEMREQGIRVTVTKTRRNHPECIDPAIKSTNFLNNIFAKVEAKKAGSHEGIMLNHSGFVAEGTVSNVFIVRRGALLTPPVLSGILVGVTRSVVMGLAAAMGVEASEEPFTEIEMRQADEVFITNTTMEVMPVTVVDGTKVADGRPGALTKKLSAAYTEEVARCLKAH